MATCDQTLVHEWFERVWNQADATAIDELMADDAVVHGLATADGSAMRGPDGFKGIHSAFLDAFPDLHIDVEDCVQSGDKIAFRCVVRGTHRGAGLGIAATGQAVEFAGMGFIRAENGRIVEAWNTFDFHRMHDQLGVVDARSAVTIPRPAPSA
jgi:steroid delta-isomerase-like uncharacterized protein